MAGKKTTELLHEKFIYKYYVSIINPNETKNIFTI